MNGVRAVGRYGARLLVSAGLVAALPTSRLAAQCPDGSPPPCARIRPALDTSRYVILPFAHRQGGQPAGLNGADCAELLSEAFERWTDLRLADKTRVYDALERIRARAPFRITFDVGLALARRLGAGKLVMGQLWHFTDTLRLSASLYDAARGGAPLRQVTTRIPMSGAQVGAAFNALADSLLGAARDGAVGAGAEQTRSLEALRAHSLGDRAIRAWDLPAATRYFRAAVAADSGFAHAYLSLGRALLWAADSSSEAVRDRAVIARRAGALLERLGPADRALLVAQQAMFERRWPDACERYREILQADSTNFAAWYGLAECHAGDPVVIRDPADTMRFVFRGSWHTAVLAYRRALLLAPSFNFVFGSRASERLTALLPVETHWWRAGRLDGSLFYAFPELEADTLAFHPFAGAEGPRQRWPATHAAALTRSRAVLTEVSSAWVEAFPQEAHARRVLARSLEVRGLLVPATGEPRSALTEIHAAQRLERRAEGRVADAITAVRLLSKAGEFDGARRLGDSLLRTQPRGVAGLAGVAVLLGRPALAARLVAPEDPETEYPGSADNQPVTVPVKVLRAGLELLAYASVGAPAESVAALEQRIEGLVAGLPAAARPAARSALLDVPAQFVFDDMGLRPAHRSTPPGPPRAMHMQWALARADTATVRATLATELVSRGGSLSGEDSPPDGVYLSARLLLSVGDTAAAERTLDAPLNALMSLHGAFLHYLPLTGGLVRMMALRSELAAARGDPATARRWAKAVIALWSGAEPVLQPTVRRMRRISQQLK